ncbi:MAG: SDR family oxidoreductase [Spirochaetota bacterium]
MIFDRFKLEGYVSLVTGAGRGLGKYMAVGLAEAGSDIVIPDIDFDLAKSSAEEIAALGVSTFPLHTNVTSPESVQSMLDRTLERFGKVDVLINNAGICKHVKVEDMSYPDWVAVIDCNLNGVFLVAQAVGRHMIQRRRGSIINISSMSGIIVNSPQNQAAYNASKAGVIALTKSMACEWAQYNVRVNTIAPGYMRIGVAEKIFQEGGPMVERWMSMTPMGRPGEPEELQGIALYLASEASSYATGDVFTKDGGYTAW